MKQVVLYSGTIACPKNMAKVANCFPHYDDSLVLIASARW